MKDRNRVGKPWREERVEEHPLTEQLPLPVLLASIQLFNCLLQHCPPTLDSLCSNLKCPFWLLQLQLLTEPIVFIERSLAVVRSAMMPLLPSLHGVISDIVLYPHLRKQLPKWMVCHDLPLIYFAHYWRTIMTSPLWHFLTLRCFGESVWHLQEIFIIV